MHDRRSSRRELIRRTRRSAVLGQTAVYSVTSALASAASGVAKALLAATLSVSGFGTYALAQTILEYGSLFTEFGLFWPAARTAALEQGEKRREVLGASLVLYLPVALAFVLLILAASTFVDSLFHVGVGHALRVTDVLALGWPFTFIGLYLAQGAGRLHVYSISTLAGQVLFLLTLLAIRTLSDHTSVEAALAARNATILVAGLMIATWLRPRFVAVRERIRHLLREARRYGLQLYAGRVLATGTYNLDVLMLAALTNARQVAFYALAGAIASALGLPAIGLGNALFARMAHSPRLERRWILTACAAGLAEVPVAWIATMVAVGTVFSEQYHPVIGLVIPLALAQGLRGVASIYNSFLAAHARGRELRNVSIVLTTSNLVLNVALIPPFGAIGAAWASAAALVANLAAHIAGYRRKLAEDEAAELARHPRP